MLHCLVLKAVPNAKTQLEISELKRRRKLLADYQRMYRLLNQQLQQLLQQHPQQHQQHQQQEKQQHEQQQRGSPWERKCRSHSRERARSATPTKTPKRASVRQAPWGHGHSILIIAFFMLHFVCVFLCWKINLT